jgi:enoyl-CoA hydratase
MADSDPLVLTSLADGVATITLNDPGHRNALSTAMNSALLATLDEIESNPEVGAIVVTGAPPAFSAGANLDDLAGATHADSLREIYAGFLRVAHSPLPTIAAVNGAAVGAGMNFALACDVILAAESAKFDTRFLQIGIHPGGGHTWRLRQITDRQTALAMVLFGEVVRGPEAERVGLAWRCVPDEELLEAAQKMATRAATFPRELVATTKRTILAGAGVTGSEEAVDLELEPQADSMKRPEFINLVRQLQEQIKSKS